MPRSVSVFGLGYVGSVTAACLAKSGNRVLGVDVNPAKVEMLESGKSPILEPELDEIVRESNRACHLHATTDSAAAIHQTEISFVSVGTPSQKNGKLDLRGMEHVCHEIGEALKSKSAYHTIVIRSTVLPGTTESIIVPALEKASGKKAGQDFAVCFVPEFLREGSAVKDFFEPPFTILGGMDSKQIAPVRELFAWATTPIYETSPSSAEMVKYVCNAFHALKVGFANEIGSLCKEMKLDTETVAKVFVTDTRLNISPAYLKPGFAFGGSCLPKDLRALTYKAKELDLKLPLLESLMPSNTEHIERAVASILNSKKRKVGMLGLSFKPGTDDLRESPLVQLAKRLLGEGCELQIWDQSVSLGRLIGSNRQFIHDEIPHLGSLLREDANSVIKSSEVVVLGTKAIDKKTLVSQMSAGQKLVDLVNLDKESRFSDRAEYEGICW
jgi:GDP-mannose 6-dehydrogenase